MDQTENFGKCLEGICKCMCPEGEIELRIKERLVHFFEKSVQNGRLECVPHLMVKEYSRPAAGKSDPKPCDLRPPYVLIQTVDYLLGSVATRNDVEWKDIYDFVFDRLRCVRQDLVIQNIGGSAGIAIFEKIIRFYVYAGYRLCTEPMGRYDPKINYQHTQECLKRLIYLYSVFPDHHDNRQEFESVYLLYNLGQSDALMHYYDLKKDIRNSVVIQLCYRTSIEYMIGNSVRCLRILHHNLCKQYPILLCAIHRHLSTMQRQSLKVMNTAYSFKASKYPVDKLVDLYSFTDRGHVITECKHCGLNVSEDKQFVNFHKGSFSSTEKEKKFHTEFIDSLINRNNLASVLIGKDASPT